MSTDRYTLSNSVGFVILAISTIAFMHVANQQLALEKLTFAMAIGVILLIFAWTDYFKLIIYPVYAFAAVTGFFLANIDGAIYALPTGAAFLVFALFLSTNREKLATITFLFTIPLALINSYYLPMSSPVAWALVGLMVGFIENAVIEEMAGGDIYIISLYFMALGPLAFIPTAFQTITGDTVYSRRFQNGREGHPVGPAMFIVGSPLIYLTPQLIQKGPLPSWLFYAHAHGVPHPGLGIIGAILGMFLFNNFIVGIGDDIDETFLGLISGAIAGLMTLSAFILLSYYFGDRGNTHLSNIMVLLSIVGMIVVGSFCFGTLSKLHYEGKSSIEYSYWLYGMFITGIILSVPLIPGAWRLIPSGRKAAILFGMIFALKISMYFYRLTKPKNGRNPAKLNLTLVSIWIITAFLAGMWTGFGMGYGIEWLLQ